MNNETLRPLGNLKEFDFYVVGTTGFLSAMEKILLEQDVPDDQIYTGDFGWICGT